MLVGKSICTEDKISKLYWRLSFSCRFPVVAKSSEISLPIIKYMCSTTLKISLTTNQRESCGFALKFKQNRTKCTATLKIFIGQHLVQYYVKKLIDLDYFIGLHIIELNIMTSFFFLSIWLGFTPCKAEQPLRGMELQEKGVEKD